MVLFKLHWTNGDKEKAYKYLINLLDLHKDDLSKISFARMFFLMDDIENGYRWLENALETRDSSIPFCATDQQLQKYQNQKRFIDIYKSIGHPLYLDK